MSWILTIDVPAEEVAPTADQLWTLGTNGIAEIDSPQGEGLVRLLAGFETEPEANQAQAEFGGSVAPVDPSVWAGPDATTVAVGGQSISIDAGQSFGHGEHPTTRLCLRALERHVTAGQRVLDVGCGSGVLALAAKALGAEAVTAIDIDPAAIEASHRNADANGLAIDVTSTTLDQVVGPFDLIVANMLAAELDPLAADIRRLASGLVIVSGSLTEQVDRWDVVFPGWVAVDDDTEGEWAGRTYRVAD